MAETFHPYKDSANLHPVKNHNTDLQMAAKKWIDSPIPNKSINGDSMTLTLKQLQACADTLADKVSAENNDEIANALVRVHNKFHEIQKTWYDEEHHQVH